MRAASARPQSNQRGIETQLVQALQHRLGHGLNRTSVGLKRGFALILDPHLDLPQSNQRGIETRISRRGCRMKIRGLNRTSVGLKRLLRGSRPWEQCWPQSNQRGIETRTQAPGGTPLGGPQSNQRGIETPLLDRARSASGGSLNRTSVGLKLNA